MNNNEIKNTNTNTTTQNSQKEFFEIAQKLKIGEKKIIYPKPRVILNGQVMTREEALEWDKD